MRGVSLEEISAATKISIRFLQAIENEELSKLPGGIFTRSFVRTYARYLGLDEERVLADCQLAGQQKPEVDIRRITANRPRPNSAASRTRIIAFLVAGVLLAGGYALFRYSRRIMEQQSSAPIVIPPSTTAPRHERSHYRRARATLHSGPAGKQPAADGHFRLTRRRRRNCPRNPAGRSAFSGLPSRTHQARVRLPRLPARLRPALIWSCKWPRPSAPGWPLTPMGRPCCKKC